METTWASITFKERLRYTGKLGQGEFQIALSARPVQINPATSETCGPMGYIGLLSTSTTCA